MKTNRLTLCSLVILLTSFVLPIKADADVEGGALITGFTGETIPGIMTRLELHWGFAGLAPENLTFRLFKLSQGGDTLAVTELPGTERKFEDVADPGQLTQRYRLEAYVGDVMLDRVEGYALVAHTGGFGTIAGKDAPHDGGGRVDINWTPAGLTRQFDEIRIFRNAPGEPHWQFVGTVEGNTAAFTDVGLTDGIRYNYMLRGYAPGLLLESLPIMGVVSEASWFDMRKINLLVIAVIVLFAVIFYVFGFGGKDMFIRKIAGLAAVDEAVGRATEMGRSVLYVPGIQDLDDVQTIAGLTILGSVAKMTAQYETRLDVPVSRSLVMSNGREIVKESYLSVGRPDFYNDDIVHYVTDEQFGYVAAVDGIMVREKPAACFYLGAFFAESLILAETGNSVGAIQIAGTAMPSQLPFFVAACDYTLIGEELFAASAYLSKDTRAIASLRGQDVGKAIAMMSIAIGALLTTAATLAGGGIFGKLADGFARLFALNY